MCFKAAIRNIVILLLILFLNLKKKIQNKMQFIHTYFFETKGNVDNVEKESQVMPESASKC